MPMNYYANQFPYIVLYRQEAIMAPADLPFSFGCWAEDTEHAEEQLLNAEPDADIVGVVQTDNVQEAYRNYWPMTSCKVHWRRGVST